MVQLKMENCTDFDWFKAVFHPLVFLLFAPADARVPGDRALDQPFDGEPGRLGLFE